MAHLVEGGAEKGKKGGVALFMMCCAVELSRRSPGFETTINQWIYAYDEDVNLMSPFSHKRS